MFEPRHAWLLSTTFASSMGRRKNLTELQQEAEELGLSTAGTKRELRQRLQENRAREQKELRKAEKKLNRSQPYDPTLYVWQPPTDYYPLSAPTHQALNLMGAVDSGDAAVCDSFGCTLSDAEDEPLATYSASNLPHAVYWTLAAGRDDVTLETLDSALKNGHIAVSEALLAGSGGGPLTQRAVEPKSVFFAMYLMDCGVNVGRGSLGRQLVTAARKGLFVLAQALVLRGARVTDRDNDGKSALDYAAAAGPGDFVHVLASSGAELNDVTFGTTPLCTAAENGNEEALAALLDAGAEADLMPPCGTALHVAVGAQQHGCLRLLLSAGADANIPNPDAKAPLVLATSAGNVHAVLALLAAGADVDAVGVGGTALCVAVSGANGELVALFLAARADVNAQNPPGRGLVPLVAALHKENEEVVRTLLAAGASPNAVALSGSPLNVAVGSRNVTLVQLLLDSGADPNGPDGQRGKRPLALAAFHRDAAIIRALVSSGADASLCDQYYSRQALLCAINAQDTSLANDLVAAGAEVNGNSGKNKCTPLTVAIATLSADCCAPVVATLLSAGAQPDCRNVTDGRTALGEAVARGRVDAACLLLAAGADPSYCASGLVSPLVLAVCWKEPKSVDVLIAAGANVAGEAGFCVPKGSPESRSLVGHAIELGCPDIARSLVKSGAALTRGMWTNFKRGRNKNCPLFCFAVVKGADNSLLKFLIDAGMDTTAADSAGWTPLMYAAKYRNVNTLALVHATNPATLNARKADGSTALHLALDDAFQVHTDGTKLDIRFNIAEKLLELGADVSLVNNCGYTPIHFVFKNNYMLDLFWPLIVKHLGSTGLVDERGRSLLVTEGSMHEQLDTCDALRLCQLGISPNAFVGDANEPLLYAARSCVGVGTAHANGSYGTANGACQVLLNHGAATGAEADGRTALATVAAARRDDLVRFFLAHGADVNFGAVTPLCWLTNFAEKLGDMEPCVRQLLVSGGDVDVPTASRHKWRRGNHWFLISSVGETPLSVAKSLRGVENAQEAVALVAEYSVEPAEPRWAAGVGGEGGWDRWY